MNDLLKRLNLENISDAFDEAYEKALKEPGMPIWLTEEFVRDTSDEFSFLPTRLDDVLTALPEVRKNEDLVLFAKTLYHMLGARKYHEEVFGGLAFPVAPSGENPLAYDMFSFFPIFARIREAYFSMRERGVDEEILRNTASGLDVNITACENRVGRLSFTKTYFLWATTHSNASLFRIGRFNFEVRENCDLKIRAFINNKGMIKILMKEGIRIHKSGFVSGSAGNTDEDGSFITSYYETENYYEGNEAVNETCLVEREKTKLSKNEWNLLYAPGDNLISMHIPGHGMFSPELLDKSLKDGMDFFKKLYPENHFKAFMCISWLLAPELKELLKPESNIINFQNRYSKFPVLCEGLDVFPFVFEKSVSCLDDVDLDSLPCDSSLRRNLIALYKSGNFVHESGGIFPFAKA